MNCGQSTPSAVEGGVPDTELAGPPQSLVTTGTHEDNGKGVGRGSQGALKPRRGASSRNPGEEFQGRTATIKCSRQGPSPRAAWALATKRSQVNLQEVSETF